MMMNRKIWMLLPALLGLVQSALAQAGQWGVVNLSVCNIHAKADFASEMTTQGLLGMPVRILGDERWYRVQLPDAYTGWVHKKAVTLLTDDDMAAWNRAEKVVVKAHYGVVRMKADECSQAVADVVAGCRLKLLETKGKYYRVAYPDGRTGYLSRKVALREREWRKQLKQDAASIVADAYTLMGVPYLWAGTSSKGVDCSGLVRTVFFMHDIFLPRDASQQAKVGERLQIAPDFGNLQPGDLIFFGRKAVEGERERVTHVGISLGGARFIHSQGDVHVSSLDAEDPLFDAFNLGRLLYANRVLPYVNRVEGINTTETNPFYAD